jgi:hypothetical protein
MRPFARVTLHSRRTSAPSLLMTAPPPGRPTYVEHRHAYVESFRTRDAIGVAYAVCW